MKTRIFSLILAAVMIICSSVSVYAGVSAENDFPEENTNTFAKALTIPDMLGLGMAYPADDPDAPFQIPVIYAASDRATGRLKVTLKHDIDIMELGASVQAAVLDGEYGDIADDPDAGIEEHLIMGQYDDGMEYICGGSYYLLEPGTYFLWNVAASNACYIVVGGPIAEEEYTDGGFGADDRPDDPEIPDEPDTPVVPDTTYGEEFEFIPGNGVANDVIVTQMGYRFEINFPIAGSYSYWINGGTKLHTEYLMWPECELILPDNGESYELYSILHVSGMGDTYEGGCTLYGGDTISFTDDRLMLDRDGNYYGEDYAVMLITEKGEEVAFRVVLNDITVYFPDYYDDAPEEDYASGEDMTSDDGYVPEEAPAISFTDVPADQWYHDTVIAAAEAGIIAGNSDGSYNPDGGLTWAQAVTFAVRLDQFRRGVHVYGAEDQTDVWYQIYVDYALDNGIIAYVPDSTGYVITRAEAAVIFVSVLGTFDAVNYVEEGYFTDIPESGEVHDAVYILAEAGICNGIGNGSFGAESSFRRSQVAAIAARMAGLADPAVIG